VFAKANAERVEVDPRVSLCLFGGVDANPKLASPEPLGNGLRKAELRPVLETKTSVTVVWLPLGGAAAADAAAPAEPRDLAP
jgi:hypothetical protein